MQKNKKKTKSEIFVPGVVVQLVTETKHLFRLLLNKRRTVANFFKTKQKGTLNKNDNRAIYKHIKSEPIFSDGFSEVLFAFQRVPSTKLRAKNEDQVVTQLIRLFKIIPTTGTNSVLNSLSRISSFPI